MHKRSMSRFQFPSNGKVYPKPAQQRPNNRPRAKVSIPFKRESVSKVKVNGTEITFTVFQFPSNGKVYPKMHPELPPLLQEDSFNSLQTGKCIQRRQIQLHHRTRGLVSIPFKRESVSKGDCRRRLHGRYRVSIPFKRESVSKVISTRTAWTDTS